MPVLQKDPSLCTSNSKEESNRGKGKQKSKFERKSKSERFITVVSQEPKTDLDDFIYAIDLKGKETIW